MSKNDYLQCPKCSHDGPPVTVRSVLEGCGNKKIQKCAKCYQVLSIEDIIPNKAEKSPDAPKLF